MPMYRDFVPQGIRPWLYILVAFTFQLSGGVYLGSLNQMIGGMALMREDILMCMYSMLCGMSLYFPILFRMKFRFTNKTLLTASAVVMLACNIVAPHITCLPLLWAVCFISGMAKIQGTFECMSNIQLWMTPERDFTFSYWWLHTCRRSYLRLCAIALAVLAGYLFGFYSLMTTDIHISQLALPVACRGFAYAALCCAFFVWLHEIMSFQHFFQALSVFNFLHAVMGGVFGCAVYARCLAYLVPDNFARYSAAIDRVSFSRAPFALGEYMEGFVSQIMEVSIKQIYGAVLYATIFLLLLFLLYDMPMRRHLRRIPMWSAVQRKVMGAYKNMRGG